MFLSEREFVRRVRVIRRGYSPVNKAKLIAFENLNLVVGKFSQYPVQDWCFEEDNHHRARYLSELDAIVHDKAGVDQSTGKQQSVAVAMGFDGDSTGHQVGGDAHDPLAEPTGRAGPTVDAYDDASSGSLSGNDQYLGQATGALATPLEFSSPRGGVAEETGRLRRRSGRDRGCDRARRRSRRGVRHPSRAQGDLDRWPSRRCTAPQSGGDRSPGVRSVDGRHDGDRTTALITLVTTYDEESGALVASITT